MVVLLLISLIILNAMSPGIASIRSEENLQYLRANSFEILDFETEHLMNQLNSPGIRWSEHYSEFYNLLASLASRRFELNVNPIIDAILAKLREDLVAQNRTAALLPDLIITVPEAALNVDVIFTNLFVTGGETITRNGDATLELKANGELVFDLPLKLQSGTIGGALKVEVLGLGPEGPLVGLVHDTTYEFGFTIYPSLVWPRVTKLLISNPGVAHIDLNNFESALDWIVAFLSLALILLILFLCVVILGCYFWFRVRRMTKEVKGKSAKNFD